MATRGGGADNGINFCPNCSVGPSSPALATLPRGVSYRKRRQGWEGTSTSGAGRRAVCRPSASSLSLLRAPTPNLTHERVPAAPKLLHQVPGDRASAGLGEPQQLQPRRGVRACKATPSTCHSRGPAATRPAARTLPQPPRPARPARPGRPGSPP